MIDTNSKRRTLLKLLAGGTAAAGTAPLEARDVERGTGGVTETLRDRVHRTLLIDTHEHLTNESARLGAGSIIDRKCTDWTLLFGHYLDSHMLSAGMPLDAYKRFFTAGMDPKDKWRLLEPVWPFIRNTGYAKAVRIAIRELYGVEDLSVSTADRLHEAYERLKKPGFYRFVLREKAGIDACLVQRWPVFDSEIPDLLKSELSVSELIANPGGSSFSAPAGIDPKDLAGWHRVIDWWFLKYGRKAVAVKVSSAYERRLDFERVPPEKAEAVYSRTQRKDPVSPAERKLLEDHLFWYAVDKAIEYQLPVKMHTGYHAQWDGKTRNMPLREVRDNPSDICAICDRAPDANFVFYHIGYPYYEEMLTVAMQYPNAYLDMCWAWSLSPLAARDFLKKALLCVPANKIFGFGGDSIVAEIVPGHAAIARDGITRVLSELVDERYISLDEALGIVDLILVKNAKKLYRL
jgi:predicted TIM-barrel fold metal-dependent hydrolase